MKPKRNFMKTISFLAVLTLVFSSSCTKDDTNPGSGNIKLEFVAEKNLSKSTGESNIDSVVAVLDVKSYNATTGEIIFNNRLADNVGEWKNAGKVNLYNKDVRLFTLKYTTDILSSLYNEPVLHYSLIDKSEIEGTTKEKHRWYILSGYPYGKALGEKTITEGEQLKGFLEIKANWNIFVEELKITGKYIN